MLVVVSVVVSGVEIAASVVEMTVVATAIVVIAAIVVSVLLLAAATVLNLLVVETTPPAKMIVEATETVVIEIESGTATTMIVVVLAVLLIVNATERIEIVETTTAMLQQTVKNAKVRMVWMALLPQMLKPTPTISSWLGTNADATISCRFTTTGSR